MNRIDTLVAELCPDGVEYRKLGEICQIKNGRNYKHLESGSVPVYGSGGFMGFCVSKASYIGPTVLLPRKGSISNVFYVEGPIWNVDTVFYTIVNEEIILTRYFYHVMLNAHIENYSTGGAARPSLTQTALNQIEIPVPPIEVQREIVRILDSFTELEAELEARRQQYAHYRDRLLSQESLESLDGKPVEMKRLGDVCVRQKGMPITAAKMKELASETGDVVVFGGGKTKVLANRDELPKGNVIATPSVVVKSRGNIGFEYCDAPFTNKNELWSYAASSSNVDIKFIYHYLESRRAFFQDAAKVGKLPQISTGVTDDFQVPVPSLATQRKVVDILDRFDALTTSLTDGIPAEIEARKVQYAYYRGRLLDFPRKDSLL